MDWGYILNKLRKPVSDCSDNCARNAKQTNESGLDNLARTVLDYKFSSRAEHELFLTALQARLDAKASELELEHLMRIFSVRSDPWPCPHSLPPTLHLWQTKEALLEGAKHVPGPWHVAQVEPVTCRIISVGQEQYNRDVGLPRRRRRASGDIPDPAE